MGLVSITSQRARCGALLSHTRGSDSGGLTKSLLPGCRTMSFEKNQESVCHGGPPPAMPPNGRRKEFPMTPTHPCQRALIALSLAVALAACGEGGPVAPTANAPTQVPDWVLQQQHQMVADLNAFKRDRAQSLSGLNLNTPAYTTVYDFNDLT